MKQCKIAYYLCCSQFTLVHKFIWEPFSTPNLDLCCCFFVFIHFKHNLQVDIYIYIYKWMDPETKIVAYNSLFVANFLCGSGAPEVDLLQKHVVRRGISTDHLGASAALRTFSSKLGGSFAVDIPISRILVNRFICLHISIWFNMYYICSYMWICYCSHDRNLCGAVTSLRTGLNLWLSGHPIFSEKPKYMYIYMHIYMWFTSITHFLILKYYVSFVDSYDHDDWLLKSMMFPWTQWRSRPAPVTMQIYLGPTSRNTNPVLLNSSKTGPSTTHSPRKIF